MKAKSTRRALVLSVITLLACAALIAGTTFAWFTDSVTTGKNVITAGNLKISAVYQDTADPDETPAVSFEIPKFTRATSVGFSATETDINANNAIINETLWEPGAVGAKLLTVRNAGTLAAKIKLVFDITDNGLTDVLWYDFVQVKDGKVTGAYTPRRMATLEAVAGAMELPLPAEGNLQFILLYGMDETADNRYMGLSFAADCTIIATQAMAEEDGFGPDYDADAVYPVLPKRLEATVTETVTAAEQATLTDKTNDVQVTIPANTLAEDKEVTFTVTTQEVTDSSVTYDLNLSDRDGGEISASGEDKIAVTLGIGKGLKNIRIVHNGTEEITDFTYDAGTGLLTIYATSFSPYAVYFEHDYAASAGNIAYLTLKEAFAAAKSGDTVRMLNDATDFKTADIITVPAGKTIVFDMNGKSLTTADKAGFEGRPIVNYGNLTVKGNGTIDSTNAVENGWGAIKNETKDSVLTVENGTFRGHVQGGGSAVFNLGTCTINDGYYYGTRAVSNEGTLVVNGGTFESTSCNKCGKYAYCVYSNGDLIFNNGTVTGVQGGLSIGGGKGVVTGGTFSTVACKEHGESTAFYAIYVAGEAGAATAEIYGGTFTSVYRAAIMVGNDNKNGDGGVNAPATVTVAGGTFVSQREGVAVMSTGPSTGSPEITGGTFSNNRVDRQNSTGDTLNDYAAKGCVAIEQDDGTYVVDTIPATKEFNGGTHTVEGKVTASGYDGAIYAHSGANVTVNADVQGVEDREFAMAVWAFGKGTKVTITGGNYTQIISGTDDQYDMIYASDGAMIEITGGTFKSATPRWTLNCKDGSTSLITVTGGRFYQFNPAAPKNAPAGKLEIIVPINHTVIQDGDWYEVVETDSNVKHVTVYEDVYGKNLLDGYTFLLSDNVEGAPSKTSAFYLNNTTTANVTATFDLCGFNITAPHKQTGHETADIAAISVGNSKGGAVHVTLTGEGVVNGGSGAATNVAVKVSKGGTVVIKSGTYTTGKTADGQGSAVVLANGGTVIIEGGFFYTDYMYQGKYWVLNCQDKSGGTIEVSGGTFVNFDPSDPQTENPNVSFVKDGYTVVSEKQANGDIWYTVVKA